MSALHAVGLSNARFDARSAARGAVDDRVGQVRVLLIREEKRE